VAHWMKNQAASFLLDFSGTLRPQDHMAVCAPSAPAAGMALKPTLSVTVDCLGSMKIEANRLASGPNVAALPCAHCVVPSYQSKEGKAGADSFIRSIQFLKPSFTFSSVKRGFQFSSK